MAMLHLPTTPLEETRAYQQLVGIGMEKGRIEGRKRVAKKDSRKG